MNTNSTRVQRLYGEGGATRLTTGFDLSDVVAGEPARLAVERPFPPSSLLLSRDKDHFTFIEG